MAIDRNLVAWLNFVGSIYTFDLKTKGPCKLAVDLTRYPGFEQVGMGFATDTVGGSTETLYLDAIGGAGLARVDMTNMTVVPIGRFQDDPNMQGGSCASPGRGTRGSSATSRRRRTCAWPRSTAPTRGSSPTTC